MTIDEIFATMADEGAEAGHEYLVIDPETRAITVPESERIFGVEADADAARKYFLCPRFVGDNLDLASMFVTVNYRNANGDEDGYLVEDVEIHGDYVTFSWQLWPKTVAYKGPLQFAVCADLPNTTRRRGPDWNTTLASGEVLEGLDPDRGDVEGETSDVVTQLRAEITASTAAVEAAGAAQVDVVEAAGVAATAAAQEQIEAKGAATLATIPADYTTMAGKVNEQANAIKGHLAGEIVQAGDVSPVEHYLGVKVQGKNLWNMAVIASADGKFTNNGDGTITVHGGEYYCRTLQKLADICPQLRVGDTVKFSIRTSGNAFVYFNGAALLVMNGYTLTITEEMLHGYVTLYGASETDETYNEPHTIEYIQLELGTVATEYAPYIDPAGVTVTRCGKNLLPFPFATADATFYGVTITSENGVLTLNGTATHGTSLPLFSGAIPVKGKYTFSGVNGGSGDTYYLQPHVDNLGRPGVTDGPRVYEWDGMLTKVNLSFSAGVTFNNLKIYPMLETGDQASAYEPYNGAAAMPDKSGTVTGLPSAAPSMTLLTDTAGVTIDCIYNRDSNAVYAELLAKIAALSGTN